MTLPPIPMNDEELVRIATELDENLTEEQKLELAQELDHLLDLLPQRGALKDK